MLWYTSTISRLMSKLRALYKQAKFTIRDFFSKCDQTRRFLRIWSHFLKKFLMENFLFCAVVFALWSCFLVNSWRGVYMKKSRLLPDQPSALVSWDDLIFASKRSFSPVCRDAYVRWYCFEFSSVWF